MVKALYENDTFKVGKNSQYNACVGNNGFVDLYTYQCGYYEATIELIKSLKKSSSYVDLLIYPIAYSARHTIELFLKDQLFKLKYINSRAEGSEFEAKIKTTHNIKELWDDYEEMTSVDKRYEPYIKSLRQYVIDFCNVDNTGETFRYPFDHDETRHLTDLGCINILIFEKRFNELYSIINELVYLTEFLIEEYAEATVVSDLSRQQIKEIAIELPDKEKWVNPEFKSVKESIAQKFNISATTLSKAISIIKTHREFASYIGLEISLNEISYDELKKYISLFNDFHHDLKTGDYSVVKNGYTDSICKNLTGDAIRSLSTLFDIGYFYLYSESYGRIIKEKANQDVFSLVYHDLLDRRNTLDKIKKALKILGQTALLKAFD